MSSKFEMFSSVTLKLMLRLGVLNIVDMMVADAPCLRSTPYVRRIFSAVSDGGFPPIWVSVLSAARLRATDREGLRSTEDGRILFV